MRRFFLLHLFFVLTLGICDLQAQKITVNASLDSTMIWIGNQAQLSFEISQQPNQKVLTPIFSESIIGGLDLVEPVKNDTTKSEDGHIIVTQKYKVTAFEDSLLYIPAFPFVIDGDTVWSKTLSLKVVQPFQIDTAANSITDIKSVFAPKFYWMGLLIKVAIGLLILAVLTGLFFLARKYFKKKPELDAKEAQKLLPPEVVAYSQLDKLKSEKPWQHGRSKEYHTELTDILREYTERVYEMRSMEMTSEEILDELNYLRKDNKIAFNSLKQVLQLADLVKFAKFNPTPDEHELSLNNSYQFVDQTKIEIIEKEIVNEELITK